MQEGFLAQLELAGAAQRRRRSVLIVDDDADQVEVLALRLGQLGFDTLRAGSAAQGLALAVGERPDLILLDLRLPDADGFEVCARLADKPATSTIPIIILSGMERPDIVRKSRAAGCQFYVRKPYDPNALLVLIEQAICEAECW